MRCGQGQVNETGPSSLILSLDELQGIEVLDSAAIRQANWWHRIPVIGATPLLPASRFFHQPFRGIPYRANHSDASTRPLRPKLLPPFEILRYSPRHLDGADFSASSSGIFNLESFLEGHDQFHGIQRVGAQIVYERGDWE